MTVEAIPHAEHTLLIFQPAVTKRSPKGPPPVHSAPVPYFGSVAPSRSASSHSVAIVRARLGTNTTTEVVTTTVEVLETQYYYPALKSDSLLRQRLPLRQRYQHHHSPTVMVNPRRIVTTRRRKRKLWLIAATLASQRFRLPVRTTATPSSSLTDGCQRRDRTTLHGPSAEPQLRLCWALSRMWLQTSPVDSGYWINDEYEGQALCFLRPATQRQHQPTARSSSWETAYSPC